MSLVADWRRALSRVRAWLRQILVSNVREVLRHAWTIRLAVMLFAVEMAQAALPDLFLDLGLSVRASDVLTALLAAAIAVARIVAQRTVSGGRDADR